MKNYRQVLTSSILRKWNSLEPRCFIRFIDGNKTNCCVNNLQYVDVKTAMLHFDDWITDYDIELTKKEVELVKCATWRTGLFNKAEQSV
jgi:hypothetical protein